MNLEIVHVDASDIHALADHLRYVFFVFGHAAQCAHNLGRANGNVGVGDHTFVPEAIQDLIALVELISSGQLSVLGCGPPRILVITGLTR